MVMMPSRTVLSTTTTTMEHESVTTDEWDSYDEALRGFNAEEDS
jgi:hypothetical protein